AMNGFQYRVKVLGGCSTTYTQVAVLIVNPGPTAPTLGPVVQPSCSVSTVSITLNGLPSGLWTLNPGNIAGNSSSYTFTGLTPGIYSYTVTTAGGCTSAASTGVQIIGAAGAPAAPTVGVPTQPNCTTATGSVLLSGLPTPGFWVISSVTGPPVNVFGAGATYNLTGLAAGDYTFTVSTA